MNFSAPRAGNMAVRAVRQKLLALDRHEASLERRVPECEPAVGRQLAAILDSFIEGYETALDVGDPEELTACLETTFVPAFRGFAFEGAAMALALLDGLTPWSRARLSRFIDGPAWPHRYLVAVGAGFAAARLPWARRRLIAFADRLPRTLGALAVDGYGFHEAYFAPERVVRRHHVPRAVRDEGLFLFDAGVGRAVWFRGGADPRRIDAIIASFPPHRQPHLWCGLGLACAYAGNAHAETGRYTEVLDRLASCAGPHRRHLEVGVVWAAEARYAAGNPTPWTQTASAVLLGMPSTEAASIGRAVFDAATASTAAARDPIAALAIYERACAQTMAALDVPGAREPQR